MAKRFPETPAHPERLCWGCDKYCPADDMRCGNGSVRTMHPSELFGPDWARDALPQNDEPQKIDASQAHEELEPDPDSTHGPPH